MKSIALWIIIFREKQILYGKAMKPEINDICILARQAGQILADGVGKIHQVTQKGIQDPVTEIDKMSEEFILERLSAMYPGHSVLSEESGLHTGDPEHVWYIDPLDGTMNYAHGVPYFCVSIAYADKNTLSMGVIYDPMRDECFYAEKGKGAFCNGRPVRVSKEIKMSNALMATGFSMKLIEMGRDNFSVFKHFMLRTAGVRRMGSAALEIAYTADGRLDAMWEMQMSAWDVAAGFVIAQEAAAIITDLQGDPDCFKPPYEYLISNSTLHPMMLAEMKTAINESRLVK